MISDRSFDDKGYDKLFHPGAVSEAVNEYNDGNDGVLQLYDRSIELDERRAKQNTSMFDRSHNKSNPQYRNAQDAGPRQPEVLVTDSSATQNVPTPTQTSQQSPSMFGAAGNSPGDSPNARLKRPDLRVDINNMNGRPNLNHLNMPQRGIELNKGKRRRQTIMLDRPTMNKLQHLAPNQLKQSDTDTPGFNNKE